MALKAGVFGLCWEAGWLMDGPDQAFWGEVGPVSELLWIDIALQSRATGYLFRHRSTANSELARTRGIRLFN